MDPLHSSAMAVPPLDLDGCLRYICSGSLRPSRSSFSLTHRRRTLLCLLAVLDASLGCDSLLCEDSRSSSLPAASIHDSTNIIPALNACSCPPSPLTVPFSANTLEVAVSLSLAPLELEKNPSPLPLPQNLRRDNDPHDPNSSGGDPQSHGECSQTT